MILGSVGCSVRHADPVDHKPPVETEPSAPTPNQTENGPANVKVQALGNVDYAKILQDATSGQELLTKVINPLSAVLLNPEVYESPVAASSLTFFHAARDFNTAILKLAKIDPAALKSSGILAKYKEAIYVDCNLELKGTCPNLNNYAREAHFPRVLVLMAKEETDVLEYYRILYTALERGRADMDQELNYMYLDRHQELAKKFLRENESPKSADLEALRLHARILQNILADFDPTSVSRAEMDRLMERFNPWDVSRRTGGMAAVGVDKLLNWASSGYMYNSTRTGLDDSFKARVTAILNGTDEIYGMGAQAIYNHIKASDSKGILTNFGFAPNIEANEYSYLVDRIFYGHFTIDDATILWNNTKKDKPALFKAVNEFVRLQIANMIVWTNGEMNRFFAEKGDAYKDLIQLLRGAVNNSLAMHAMWDRTLNRIDTLINFVDREYGKVDPFLLPDSDEYKQFTNSVSGLRNNIKMLSVYPNMMMIVYLMAKKNFQATIMTWFGPVTITPYEVIKWFFIDVMPPWFNFGTDGTKLSQVELLYSIHFAMVTETFSTFRNNPVIPVNEAEFFQAVTEKLINDEVQTAIDDAKKTALFENSNSKLLREALAACSEEKAIQATEAPGEIKPRRYHRSFGYTDITQQLANGYARTGDTQTGILARFYSSTLGIDSTVARMMAGTEARMLFLRNMLGIMKDYVEQTGGNAKALEDAYNSEAKRYVDASAEYLKSVYKQKELYGDCAEVLVKHEKDLRDAIFGLEEAYVTSVFNNLSELNILFKAGKKEDARQKAAEYNAALATTPEDGVPAEYKGFDKYVENAEGYYFNYHKLDTYIRVRRNLLKLTPNTEISLPTTFKEVSEFQTPAPYPLVLGDDASVDVNREAFVKDGMRRFMVNLNMSNIGMNFIPTYRLDKLDVLARLYRLGPVTENGELGCKEKCKEVTAEEIIRYAIDTIKESEMTEWDLKIMTWAGTDDLYEDGYWTKVAMEEGNRRHLGLLDLTFHRVADDTSGALHGGISNYFLELTKKYYDTQMSVGNFFFEPRPSINAMIKKNYSGYVWDYEDKVDAFLAKYEELRKDPSLKIDGVHRNRRDFIAVPVDSDGLPIYITTERKNKYTGNLTIFHERTSGEFKRH